MSLTELSSEPRGGWYVIHTKPRQESVALENLERQGYRCFLPMVAVQRIHRGKWLEAEECMFRRYLFIRLVAGQSNFSPIRNTRGVAGMVRFGTLPAIVPDEVIDALMSLPSPENPLFKKGHTVLITEGPFAGLAAEFCQLEKSDDGEVRALVLLEFLSKLQRLSLPARTLKPVD